MGRLLAELRTPAGKLAIGGGRGSDGAGGEVAGGLAAVGAPVKVGWVPAEPTTLPLPIRKFPRNHSKPKPRVSFWVTSTNLLLTLIWGGAMFRTWTARSMMSRSESVA